MKQITILTPDNIQITYPLATTVSRTVATAIDAFIQLLLMIPALSFYFWSFIRSNALFIFRAPNFMLNDKGTAFIIIYLLLVYFLYPVASEFIFKGQTLGKRMIGIRSIRDNGQPLGFSQVFIRHLFKYSIEVFGFGIIIMAITKENKRIGDYLASSVVIVENPHGIELDSITLADISNKPAFSSSAVSLKKEEYEVLKAYFAIRFKVDNSLQLLARLQRYFAKAYEVPESALTEGVLEELLNRQGGNYNKATTEQGGK